ncbi:C4-dicarboxylate TRAP transporter large permease protein DctM [Oceanobacillus oncorhynchi subsp. incaldanensis]|uniref:Sialic acid TRAP transporter permease protein SiaT n=2 Tax=Oceanobacillus TaxID=182709 RepID=A0A0A1MS91_9BACI|nr:TRAP transporter large permease [Oceanobacillus oncorhynchi]MDM8100165.1 TRAP transporter large permease [Oceanobacillus oncorhynchi]GIO19864.1 C4-dicarboxylate TRAP transporter large permease protein DctM [Oceanobacillus oncorhynchi subsp. incaldanensis]CEI82462.1 Sialic acid TRAP transporter permease protein SiaT [Oceanobacillus oncorhynchi]
MLATLLSIMIVLLFLNFPMMIPLMLAPVVVMLIFNPNLNMDLLMGQLLTGISSSVLLCVPLFIFAADIMTSGKTSNRLLDFIGSFIGHIRGGYAVTTAAACSVFGAISGSTQAAVVAIGRPMRDRMLKAGYKDSSAIALIINASDVALLIPPSIGMIIYALAAGSGVSVGDLFIAGIIPGIMVFLAFAIYSVIYAKAKDIPLAERQGWGERWKFFRKALLPLAFPVIIVGGIYTGIFSPVEASGIAVLYAFILEVFIFRTIPLKKIPSIALSTGLVTSAVFVLVAGGQLFSWVLGYARIPQQISEAVLGTDPSAIYVLIVVSIFFFIGCMFVDPIVVILVLTPIFIPAAETAGVDLIHLGIIITFQAALGSATPPFGVDIFTASAVFNKPYLEVIRSTPPYILILLLIGVLLIFFPQLSLVLIN